MPRKRSSQAEAKAKKAQEAQWMYLCRNPDFLKDLQDLHQLVTKEQYNLKKFLDSRERVADKYGLLRVPSVIANLAAMDRSALESYGTEFLVSYTPVTLGELKEGRFLFFRIDLNHPVDDLLPLIEEQLRDIYRHRPKRRRRLDRVQFNCKVYDLAEQGKFSLRSRPC
jgi:hypothetical protein